MKGKVDALFGSKTRVKLLELFMSNPGKSFYVREITRLIEEQINSVRRELANMLKVGIITSESADNKLYYEVNQRYQFYVPLRAMFAGAEAAALETNQSPEPVWYDSLRTIKGVKLVLLSGVLVEDSSGKVDLVVVGSVGRADLKKVVETIESFEGREINYTALDRDDFRYRVSMRDRFISEILQNAYSVLIDKDDIMKSL